MEVDEKIKNIFKEWSKVLVESEEDLIEEFKQRYEEDKKIHPQLTEEERKIYILNWMKSLYQRQFRSQAKKIEGYIIGYTDEFDPNVKERALALQEGRLNENGVPVFASPEWKKGMPIPEDERMRIFYGVGRIINEGEETEYKPFKLYFRVRGQKIPKANLFKKVIFRANVSNTQDDVMTLSNATITKFIEKDEEKDLKTISKEYLRKYIGAVEEAKEHTSTNFVFITRGVVSRITFTSEGIRSNVFEIGSFNTDNITLDVEGGNIPVFLHKDLDIDFGEGSVVYVVGIPAIDKNNNVMIGAVGYWADPKFKTNPENVKPITVENSQIVEKKDSVEDEKNPESKGDVDIDIEEEW